MREINNTRVCQQVCVSLVDWLQRERESERGESEGGESEREASSLEC